MDGYYIYGICSAHADSSGFGTGLGGESLSLVPAGDVAAVVSPVRPSGCGAAAAFQTHADVCERIFSQVPMLPSRFGTRVSSCRDAIEHLCSHGDRYARALAHIENRVEIGLRVLPMAETVSNAPPAEDKPATGTDYLKAQSKGLREASGTVPEYILSVHREIAARAADTVRTRTRDRLTRLSAAYLVNRDRVADISKRVRAAAAREPLWRLILTGPWPPYHFTGEVTHA